MPMVFIVDDEELVLKSLSRLLRRAGFDTATFSTGEQALARREERPDLLVCDYRLPRTDGLTIVREFKDAFPKTKTMLLSGGVPDEAVTAALDDGTLDLFFAKPWMLDDLLSAVGGLLPPPAPEPGAPPGMPGDG